MRICGSSGKKKKFTQSAITCLKLTIKVQCSHLCSSVSIVNFEQVNTGWVETLKKDFPKEFEKLELISPNQKLLNRNHRSTVMFTKPFCQILFCLN